MARAKRPLRHRPLNPRRSQVARAASPPSTSTAPPTPCCAKASAPPSKRSAPGSAAARRTRSTRCSTRWWSRLAGRLDAGPAALHRLPEAVLLAAEGLWLQAARRRTPARDRGAGLREELSLARTAGPRGPIARAVDPRAGDRATASKQSESRAAPARDRDRDALTMLRKEQASRASAERRLHELRDRAAGGGRAPQPAAAAATPRKPKIRKPATKPARIRPAPRRNVPRRSKRTARSR